MYIKKWKCTIFFSGFYLFSKQTGEGGACDIFSLNMSPSTDELDGVLGSSTCKCTGKSVLMSLGLKLCKSALDLEGGVKATEWL